eukprot:scaffold649675_cov41-Prasinocladus_malaysianus.AAC.1
MLSPGMSVSSTAGPRGRAHLLVGRQPGSRTRYTTVCRGGSSRDRHGRGERGGSSPDRPVGLGISNKG